MKKQMALFTVAGSLVLSSMALASPARFLGNWSNTNRSTRNIVRVEVTGDNKIHLFGACTPTPCDMGKVPLVTYGRNVSDTNHMAATAQYSFGFKKMTVIAKVLGPSRLYLETYSEFTDGSGRQNYWMGETFIK